ncbi:HMA2 domain-containing protein [Chlorogloeopsis sp. ULAP02]|uniref:HMA2 domain-containing protein n=1 Tax=Chlorogloeopsis sp. ULAP02 TaxID=3107926 RepID=UPI003134A916
MPVQSPKVDYQVVHAITGRIRIRVPRLKTDPDYGDRLQQIVKSLDVVTDVRVNAANASVVVQYNSADIENKVMQRELATCIQKAEQTETTAPEPSVEPVAERTEQNDVVIEDVAQTTNKSAAIQVTDEYLSQIDDQFPINVDLENKLFEIGIPALQILQPLNVELKKFAAEHEKNTDLQRIQLDLEAFLREGGFLINGKAHGKFRETFIVNPITRRKHHTPWMSIAAVGIAELDATVVDETINVNLTKLKVSGDSGKWYKELVKYAFEYLFKTKLVAKINDALSKIDGAKVQQIFFQLKGNEKVRAKTQKLGLTPEKLDELLELVEVNARVSPDYLWLYVQL